jgi:hypothetical protein
VEECDRVVVAGGRTRARWAAVAGGAGEAAGGRARPGGGVWRAHLGEVGGGRAGDSSRRVAMGVERV